VGDTVCVERESRGALSVSSVACIKAPLTVLGSKASKLPILMEEVINYRRSPADPPIALGGSPPVDGPGRGISFGRSRRSRHQRLMTGSASTVGIIFPTMNARAQKVWRRQGPPVR